jgi:hypothetical protein
MSRAHATASPTASLAVVGAGLAPIVAKYARHSPASRIARLA